MAEPFLAEIKIFAGNFAPTGFALCNGQILPISQNAALFSLLGTTFGGNGTSNFGLPNFQGSAPLGFGQGPGLSSYVLGQTGGTTTVTILQNQIPSHSHTPACFSTSPNPTPVLSPAGSVWAVAGSRRSLTNLYKSGAVTASNMNASSLATAGSGQPHNNMQPYLALTFIIALVGIFPSRN
jgi:microcystin-dependent protein